MRRRKRFAEGGAGRSDRPAVTNLRPFVLPILILILSLASAHTHSCTRVYLAWRGCGGAKRVARVANVRAHTHRRAKAPRSSLLDAHTPLLTRAHMSSPALSVTLPTAPVPSRRPLPPERPPFRRHPTAKRYSSQKVALCRSVSRPPQKFHAYLDRRHRLFAPR